MRRLTARRTRGRRALRLSPLILSLLLVSSGARAAESRIAPAVPPAPELKIDRISLNDAVRLTLQNSPAVQQARQSVALNRGRYQQASGQFDSILAFTPSYSHQMAYLISTGLKPEIQRRDALYTLGTAFAQIAADLQKDRRDMTGIVTTTCLNPYLSIDLGGGSLVCLTNPSSPQGLQIRNFNDILFTATSANTGSPLGNQLTAVSGRYLGFYQPLLTSFVDGAQMVADRSFQALANLGPLPSVDVIETLNVDLRYLIPFRNGWSLQPLVSFQGIKDNYEGKSDITSRGGKGVYPSYQAIFGLALVAPLSKNSSATAVDAAERAARRNLEAAIEALAQAGSQAVRDTVLAYWDLAAAEERVKLLERSARNQRQIGELSESLVKADEIPASEMNRIRARTADADGQVAQAKQAVTSARITLALSMGLSVADLDNAPLTTDPLPETEGVSTLATLAAPDLTETAVKRRSDVKASRERETAASILEKAARFNLRPQIDLTLQADYRGFYEYTDPVSGNLGHDTFWMQGYWNAMKGPWTGPSILAGLRFSFPLKNNVARGQLVQAEALRTEAEIQTRDLERTVRIRTVETANSTRKAAQEVTVRRESTVKNEETVRSSYEQYKAGEMSLVDAILTERNWTNSLLDLVAARRVFASSLTQLRYETGSLLPYQKTDSGVSFGDPQPRGFDFSAPGEAPGRGAEGPRGAP